MKKDQANNHLEITALKVHQWLEEWEKVNFNEKAHRRRPVPQLYLFTLPAAELKALSGIYRRTTKDALPRSLDLGIQRRHDEDRSDEIREFIRYGYPWSNLSKAKRKTGQFDDLRNPGWLPTAIVVNILKPGDKRRNREVANKDIVSVFDSDQRTAVIKPPEKFTGADWQPSQLHPIEVIDGQHRLWAFEDHHMNSKFQLPIVAFYGLDISWQAYLFWSINIKPKRINPSLAFDLYPLLRTEEWLQRFDDRIYRETRAQELTEALWAHPDSPWYQRINMLGEPGLKTVSQAAWINSLMTTYIKAWEGPGIKIGGLFGAPVGKDKEVLPWSRAQQAAFLIFVWQVIRDSIEDCKEEWAQALRSNGQRKKSHDPAFVGPHTLLNTDQGVRGTLFVTNDLFYANAEELKLENWVTKQDASSTDENAVREALKSLRHEGTITTFLNGIAKGLSKYDWRTSTAEGLSEEQRIAKLVFRGSGGYREIRRQLLRHLALKARANVGKSAENILKILGYD